MKIMDKTECTAEQMAQYLINKNPNSKSWALEYAKLYIEEGNLEGVRADVAWVQSIIETGCFKFGGGTAVTFDQNNFCGLGVTRKGIKGNSFSSPRLGIRAQIQHLKGYGTSKPLFNPCVDPRYDLIKPKGKAPNVEDLGGLWAVPGYDTNLASSLEDAKKKKIGYGFDIINGVNAMKKIIVKKNYLVAVDAGHSSQTAGKETVCGYKEHWINVRSAIYFVNAMDRCGIKTIKVGWDDNNATDDIDISLSERQRQIKNAQCDISVSWHANASGNKGYDTGEGIETFIHSSKDNVNDSKALATKVQNYLIQGTKQKNRGVKSANFAMVNCTAMGTKASILIETAFMNNQREEELLLTNEFSFECAEEAAKGVCEYLGVKYIGTSFYPIDVKVGNYNKTNIVSVPLKVAQTTRDIQKFLNTYYGTDIKRVIGSTLVVDGIIGANSKKALAIALQVELNKLGAKLVVDGLFGINSENAFNKYVGLLKQGMKSNIFTTIWQCLLVGFGLDPRGIDGIFGNGTLNATNELFSKFKLAKDSSVSGADINKIL